MNHGYPPAAQRGAGPPGSGPQGAPSQRLNELLDQIRNEFDTESQRGVEYEGQSRCHMILSPHRNLFSRS